MLISAHAIQVKSVQYGHNGQGGSPYAIVVGDSGLERVVSIYRYLAHKKRGRDAFGPR